MIVTSKVKMDLERNGLVCRIDAVQGDTNTREVALSLYAGGIAWKVPDGATVQIRYRKADRTGGAYDTLPDGTQAWSVSENTVTVILAPQMLTVKGEVKMQVVLLQGEESLATFSVSVDVEEDPSIGAVKSQDYVNMRGWLVRQLDGVLEAAAESGTFVPEIGVGTVTALAPDRSATASVTQNGKAAVLNLGIPAGYTPVKGVDYWTEAEREEMQAALQVGLAAQTPLFADSVEECTDTAKVYVLPDGMLYAYMTKTIYTEPEELYDPEAASLNVRHSGSPGSIVTGNGYVMTDYIPVAMTDRDPVQLRIGEGIATTSATKPYFQKIAFYDSAKACLGTTYITSTAASGNGAKYITENGLTTVDVGYLNNDAKVSYYDRIAYVRIEVVVENSPAVDSDRSAITGIVDPNSGGAKTQTGWMSTGHAFVPADYEDRIIALEETAQAHTAELFTLQNGGQENTDIPAYWQAYLEEKVVTIQALQKSGGKDCFSFAAIADIHESANLGKRSGALARYLMQRCDIKYVLGLGDAVTRSSVTAQADMDASFARAEKILEPVRSCLLQTQGNHDGSWNDDGNTYYICDFTPEKMHSLIYRKVGMVPGVTADDTGSAYYADDPANRVRYIILNSHWAPYEENSDGSAKYSTFRNARFGQAQYDWLIAQGLNVPDGWGIIVGSHVPLSDAYASYFGGSDGDGALMRQMLAAYNNREIFSGSFGGTMGYDGVMVEADFTNAAGRVIAAVAGHTHTDTNADYGFPVITVRCDAAEENTAQLQEERVPGTVTEQSFDIFTVNRNTRTIYATKIGAGADRVISY